MCVCVAEQNCCTVWLKVTLGNTHMCKGKRTQLLGMSKPAHWILHTYTSLRLRGYTGEMDSEASKCKQTHHTQLPYELTYTLSIHFGLYLQTHTPFYWLNQRHE